MFAPNQRRQIPEIIFRLFRPETSSFRNEIQEVRRVTFQIGLFCPTGMVLASDTKLLETGTQMHIRHRPSVKWGTTAPKFCHDESMRTVVAIAGDRLARVAARNLIAKWDSASNLFELERIAQEPFSMTPMNVLSSLIVVRPRERKMFHFILGAGTSTTEHSSDKVIQGDCATSAVLLLERYVNLSNCSFDKLKEIAALTVWLSSQLAPEYIAGLQMIEFQDGKPPHVLEQQELHDLERRAESIDGKVKELFA
jgi:hypothetical protein